MANTYTQIYLHVVFAVSGRACVISAAHREELQKYITGIVTRQGQKLIAVYCMPDHTHVLLGLKPNIAPSDLIGTSKRDRPITLTSSAGSDVGSRGRRATAHFRFPIPIWIVWPTTFKTKTNTIGESHFSRNMLNFCSDIMFHTINVTFSSQ
jgi:REP element-mobilizing transposase RayT